MIFAESDTISADGLVAILKEIRTKLDLNTGDTVISRLQYGECFIEKDEDEFNSKS